MAFMSMYAGNLVCTPGAGYFKATVDGSAAFGVY